MRQHIKTRGQGLVEYALLVALLTVGLILVLQISGVRLSDVFCTIGSTLTGEDTCNEEGTIACSDDFSDGMKDWESQNGAWKAEDGRVCTSGVATTFDNCSASLNLTNYTINLKDVELTKGNGYGVFFRTTIDKKGKYNGYTFQYDPGYAGGAFIFRKWVNGKELAPFAVAPAKGFDWYGSGKDVSISVNGDEFTAYVDGKAVLTGKDSSYTEGGAGLRSWDGSNVCIDEFNISLNSK